MDTEKLAKKLAKLAGYKLEGYQGITCTECGGKVLLLQYSTTVEINAPVRHKLRYACQECLTQFAETGYGERDLTGTAMHGRFEMGSFRV